MQTHEAAVLHPHKPWPSRCGKVHVNTKDAKRSANCVTSAGTGVTGRVPIKNSASGLGSQGLPSCRFKHLDPALQDFSVLNEAMVKVLCLHVGPSTAFSPQLYRLQTYVIPMECAERKGMTHLGETNV